MAGRVGAERGEAIAVLFDKVWHERKGLKGARKLLDATMRTAEGRELKPTLKDANTWVEDEPRRQVYKRPQQEWPGAAQMGGEDDQILSVDSLDFWSAKSARVPGQDGYNYVMVAQSRWDRKLYARPFKNKQANGDAVDAMAQILRDLDKKPKEIVVDLGPEYASNKFKEFLARKDIVYRPKNAPGDTRATMQNLAQVDSAMGKYAGILKEHQRDAESKAWLPFVQDAVKEYNSDGVYGRGMMGSAPDDADGNKVLEFNIQKAAADGYSKGQDIQAKAREKLTQDGAFRTQRKQNFAGKRQARTRDPTWNAKIHYVDNGAADGGFEGGYVRDTAGTRHLAGKVLAVPSRTRQTAQDRTDPVRAGLDELGVGDMIKTVIEQRGGQALLQFIARKVGLQKEPLQAKIQEAAGRQIKNIEIVRDVYDDIFDFEQRAGPVGGMVSLKNQGVDEKARKRKFLLPFATKIVELLKRSGGTLAVDKITHMARMGDKLKEAMLKSFTARDARHKRVFYEFFDGELWTYKASGDGTGGTVTVKR